MWGTRRWRGSSGTSCICTRSFLWCRPGISGGSGDWQHRGSDEARKQKDLLVGNGFAGIGRVGRGSQGEMTWTIRQSGSETINRAAMG